MKKIELIPKRPIGFRLANELEGLLLGISADGVINDAETQRVRAWLEANREHAGIHPFSELACHLETALADGRIDPDECEDLLFVTSKFTRVNPYFDQIRGGVQELMGVLAGVAADRLLNQLETEELSNWLDAWSHLKGLWPYDECEALATSLLTQRRLGTEAGYLLALAAQFPVAGEPSASDDAAPSLTVGGICAVDPTITFADRDFVFTGDSAKLSRDGLEDLIRRLGGAAQARVTRDSDYLVVCAGGSPHWAFSCYGRKVEKAYNLRRSGLPILIVHENDFWDAVVDSGATA